MTVPGHANPGTPAMPARIYQPSKTAMQSGRGRSRQWVLEFEPAQRKTVEPLMGWTSSADMMADEVRLRFATREEAVAYAERHGIAYVLGEPNERQVKPKSYAANFRWDRPR